ncbi:hypothetical protein V8C86DRAFT_2462408 [Haematococcus lacustris]
MQDSVNPFMPPAYAYLGPRLTSPPRTASDDATRDQLPRFPPTIVTQQPEALASSMAGLTIAQVLDLDAENLAVNIDRQHMQTKKAIVDQFMDIKSRMMQAQTLAVDEERRVGASKLAAKQAEIDLLRFELNQSTTRVNKQQDMLRGLATAYDLSKYRKRCTSLVVQTFYCWRQHAILSRQRKQRWQRAVHWHAKEHLLRHVLRAWRYVAQQDGRITMAHSFQSELQAVKQQLHDQYTASMNELRQQLAEADAALSREAVLREKLEENMKQAFMRGVCALNIEAMSIMKRGAPPGGANPIPVMLPPSSSSQPPGLAGPPYSNGAASSLASAAAPQAQPLTAASSQVQAPQADHRSMAGPSQSQPAQRPPPYSGPPGPMPSACEGDRPSPSPSGPGPLGPALGLHQPPGLAVQAPGGAAGGGRQLLLPQPTGPQAAGRQVGLKYSVERAPPEVPRARGVLPTPAARR